MNDITLITREKATIFFCCFESSLLRSQVAQ